MVMWCFSLKFIRVLFWRKRKRFFYSKQKPVFSSVRLTVIFLFNLVYIV
jgi:hypothetical protein